MPDADVNILDIIHVINAFSPVTIRDFEPLATYLGHAPILISLFSNAFCKIIGLRPSPIPKNNQD